MKKTYSFYVASTALLFLILTGGANAVLPSAEKVPTPSTATNDSQAIPEELTKTAWGKIKASLEQDRYRIHKDKHTSGYQAPNPAHDLDAAFSREGIEVSPRKGKKEWRWGLSLARYGYGSNLQVVPGVEKMITKDNRIEYHRGELVEWYVNDHRGLEQGFDLRSRPPDREGSELLQIEMKTTGNLIPKLHKKGKTIAFQDAFGSEMLRYSGLYAYDAKGKTLDSRMVADGERIRLIVNDHRAVYPITIDPFIETKKLLASDGAAYDSFGISVSISGDTAIVGAFGDDHTGVDSGSAYIFYQHQGGGNNWGQVRKLTASDAATEDFFGRSVSISEDTAIVGAYGNDDNGDRSGSAYIFQRDQGGVNNWGQVQKLTASDGARFDDFGYSVSISEDMAIVGALNDDDHGSESGSAYIFYRDRGGANNWGQVQKLTTSDGAGFDYFGHSVSISGNTTIVGARQDDDNGSNSGSAYIFYRNEGGLDNWGEVQKLTASDGAAEDHFGGSVSIVGVGIALVGASGDDDNGTNSGSAYMFYRDQGGPHNWGQGYKFTPPVGGAGDYFGYSVSITEDRAIIGAYGDDDNGSSSGSAFIYLRDQGGPHNWGFSQQLIAGDGAADDWFGYSVSISGYTAIVGAYRDDDNGTDSGSAYIFGPIYYDELATDFGTDGLWHYDGSWSRMTTWDADDGMAGWSSGLGVDFGTNGVWNFDGSSWSRISTWDAGSAGLCSVGTQMPIDFDVNGLWRYHGMGFWYKLSNWDPDDDMTGWDYGLAVDFGGSGLWTFNGSTWRRLTTWDVGSAGLAGWNGSLAADFDANGLWRFDGYRWSKMTNWDPEDDLTRSPCGLAVDFGTDGLWLNNGYSWSRITTWDAQGMSGLADGLVVDFGTDGVWKYNCSSWSKLTNWNPENMSECDLN